MTTRYSIEHSLQLLDAFPLLSHTTFLLLILLGLLPCGRPVVEQCSEAHSNQEKAQLYASTEYATKLKYAKATAQAAKNCSFVSHLLPTIHYAHAKEYRLRLSAHAMNLVAKRRYQSVV
mmetsp:Transcript_35777/g.98923  ORF Transcript_35777/g.98923 Transcript_35777/m.98923 type:complete len:119 (-) Transcript_35777:1509-1865(-)